MVSPRLLLLALPLLAAGCGGSSSAIVPPVGADVTLAELAAAATNLSQFYSANATYVGASPGVPGVTLVRADATSFCLQTATTHELGPRGTPQPGPCA